MTLDIVSSPAPDPTRINWFKCEKHGYVPDSEAMHITISGQAQTNLCLRDIGDWFTGQFTNMEVVNTDEVTAPPPPEGEEPAVDPTGRTPTDSYGTEAEQTPQASPAPRRQEEPPVERDRGGAGTDKPGDDKSGDKSRGGR